MDPKSRVSQGKPSKPNTDRPKSNFETMLEVGLRSLEGSARAGQFDRMVDALELLALTQYVASPDLASAIPFGKRMSQLAEKIAGRTSPATFAETMAAVANGGVHHCTKCKTQHGGTVCSRPVPGV